MISVTQRSNAHTSATAMYAGTLSFDLGRWQWGKISTLHQYSTKLGRTLIKSKLSLSCPVPSKWVGAIPATYKPNWKEVWAKGQPHKELGFLWSLYHDTIAVNAWRYRINPNISLDCKCCNLHPVEKKLHRFFLTPRSR